MAKAEVKFKTEKKETQRTITEVREVKEVEGITLTLSPHEARTLRSILRAVGGSPKTSLRGVADRVEWALRAVGVGYYVDEKGFTHDIYSGSIHMHDDTDQQTLAVEDESLPEPEEVFTGTSEDRPPLRVGAKILITNPDMPQGYDKGDVLTVRSIVSEGVYVSDARYPYDYPRHSTGAYVTLREFEVIG